MSCERFAKNREKLAELIYSLESFEAEELIEKFRELNDGDTVIDGSQTIRQWLERLRDLGALDHCDGGSRYFVVVEQQLCAVK